MIAKGEVLFDPAFIYPQGNTADKYVICLSNIKNHEDGVFVPVTSQQGRKLMSQGCNPSQSYYFIPPATTDMFLINTWVQFDAADLWICANVERNLSAGKLVRKGILKPQLTKDLVACALKADDFIPGYKLQLILSK